MSRRTSAPIAVLAGALILGGALAGCSELRSLNPSGSAGGQGAGMAKETRQQTNPNHPTQTIDPRDASGTPAPPRTLPIPGSGQNPTASGPQGALPDPYANPPR